LLIDVRRKSDPILVLFFVSGFSGLIYESVWSHYLKIFVGHAAYAQTLVLVVFIGGLALGSAIFGRIAERVKNPLRLYAIAEATIGVIALVFHTIFVSATNWAYDSLLPAACDPETTLCVAQWVLAVLLLAPQSILLGTTFPLVCSAVLRLEQERPGEEISALYFLNSLGAVLGVLASAFMLIPAVGLPGTLMAAGMINVLIGVVAYSLSKVEPPALVVAASPTPVAADALGRRLVTLLLATALLTGLSSFIYEIAWIRMLSFVLGASTYSFEIMLASFILGIALGGLWVRSRIDRLDDPVRFLGLVQIAMGIAAAGTLAIYGGAFEFMAWILSAVARNEGGFLFFNLSSTVIALLVMLPATFCAGMTLPLITYRLLRAPTGERSIGLVYAFNTVGSLIGVVIAVHLLLGAVGLRWTLIAGAVIDVVLGVVLITAAKPREGARWNIPREAFIGVAILAVIAVLFDIDPRRSASGVFRNGVARLAPNEEVVFHRDGKTASVDVLRNPRSLSIRTNGKPDAAIAMGEQPTGDEFTMTLLSVLPLGHRPEAKTAAVIGFGSGMSTALMLASPNIERVDTIEIEPSMVEGAKNFRPMVEAAYSDPRSRIVIDDAKSFFARGKSRYDIIVSEPSNPWVSGVASLFSQEFYQRMSGYMNDGAVLAQWLHTYEMDSATLASILVAVSRTFPEFVVYSSIDSDLVLVARKGSPPGRFDPKVLAWPKLQPMLTRLKMTDGEVVRRRAVGHWRTLGPFFAPYGSPPNSDYFPFVDQRAGKTRFTRARVDDLVELLIAPVPLLEMLDGSHAPAAAPHAIIPTTMTDLSSTEAWRLRGVVLGTSTSKEPLVLDNGRESAARLVRAWSQCNSDLSFEQVLPALTLLAQATNPYLDPASATSLWRSVEATPCGRRLTPDERRWTDLFTAVAQRSAEGMAAGRALLEKAGPPSEVTEFAWIASVAGLICRGEPERARILLEKADTWMRPNQRLSERRYLGAMIDPRRQVVETATCKPKL
jgi:predicted membrane-bound spermidine synthase